MARLHLALVARSVRAAAVGRNRCLLWVQEEPAELTWRSRHSLDGPRGVIFVHRHVRRAWCKPFWARLAGCWEHGTR